MAYPADLSYAPETRVVLFGNRHFRHEPGLPELPHAEQNILYLSRLFSDPDIVGLPQDCIVTLLDRAEASEALTEIARAASQATDTLIVYYAGHGLYGDAVSPLYLAVGNTTLKEKSFNGLPISKVKEAIRTSPARKRVLILDCCYSGRAFDGAMSDDDAVGPAIDVDGTFGIAAVPGDMKALAPPGESLTRFTGALVDVLQRGVERDTAVLTLGQVFQEVQKRVGRKADAPLPRQANWDQAEFFRLARNRSLHRQGLDRIFQAVEGLRESVTEAGARLQALEVKAGATDALAARLEALEARPAAAPMPPEPGGAAAWPLWQRVQVPRAVWEQLPAEPYKRQVRRYFAGRLNARIILAAAGALTVAGVLPLVVGTAGPLGRLLPPVAAALLALLATAAFSGLLAASRAAVSSPSTPLTPEAEHELRHNETLAGLLNHPIVRVLGFDFDARLGWLTGLFCVLGATVISLLLLDAMGHRPP